VLGFFVPSHVKREVSIPERHGVVVPKINVDQVGVLHVDEPHEETTYKEEYRRGLEETGAKLDQWMKQRWGLSGEQWEQVGEYREAYKSFRSGNAQGCKGEGTCLLASGERGSDYREQYRNFRTGRPHGCRTLSSQ